MTSELGSRTKIHGLYYKLVAKSGSKDIAHQQVKHWREKGYSARVVKVADTGWKWGIYIRKLTL